MLQVRAAGANPQAGRADLELYRPGQVVIGMCDPLGAPQLAAEMAAKGVSLFALELLPRITRAQSMDVLSSQATIAGYRAVLLAAESLAQDVPHDDHGRRHAQRGQGFCDRGGRGRLAGHRHGPAAWARPFRPTTFARPSRSRCRASGAKFVEMPLETAAAETKGGYAQQMDEEFYRKQRELMARVVAESDVVITTAAVPGKKSPILVTAEMVAKHGPRLGDRRSGGRARRQLRVDQARTRRSWTTA